MKTSFRSFLSTALLGVFLLGTGTMVWAQEPSQQPAPDNSKVNQRDRNKAEPTADQQMNNRSDLELTRQIRKALMNDKSLSSYAHNVKIIAQDGAVTLKGPVRSEEEKTAIEAKATEVAGNGKVTSQLEVKPKK
jgi:hyperosmotically inducible protein